MPVPEPAGTGRPCERVRVAGQAAPRDLTGLSGGHDLKLNAPARDKMHGSGAKFH